MAEYDLLVLNGLVVTDQETGQFDIAIKDGKIAKLASRGSFSGEKSKKIIDAQGGMVMVCYHSRLLMGIVLSLRVARRSGRSCASWWVSYYSYFVLLN
jgi:predicted amidohydrolase